MDCLQIGFKSNGDSLSKDWICGKQMNPAKQSEAERTETSKLPNTATSIYNWLALGILVLLIGVVLYLRLRCRNDRGK